MKRISPILFSALIAFSVALPASAQYVWLDKNNVKVYSDKPPPADVPASRVLKGPRGYQPKTIEEDKADKEGEAKVGNADKAAAPTRPMTNAEKNADFNKRRLEKEEKEKKEALEEKNRQAKAENCERARAYQRALQSGQRISRTGDNGERKFMGDDERANETRQVEDTLKECN